MSRVLQRVDDKSCASQEVDLLNFGQQALPGNSETMNYGRATACEGEKTFFTRCAER